MRTFAGCVLVLVLGAASLASAQAGRGAPPSAQSSTAAAPVTAVPPANMPAGVVTPTDYVIGPDDQLSIFYWKDKDMSSDVTVRPDGKISLPLVNDLQAAGLSPEQLRQSITQAAAKFVEDPTVSVVVKQINSRRVFITGQVAKPGPYSIVGPMTVLQLITTAGGVLEYAKTEQITILRTEKATPRSIRFNYKEVLKGKNLRQNIELMPGDQVLVP